MITGIIQQVRAIKCNVVFLDKQNIIMQVTGPLTFKKVRLSHSLLAEYFFTYSDKRSETHARPHSLLELSFSNLSSNPVLLSPV